MKATLKQRILGWIHRKDLKCLAAVFGTDKHGVHFYMDAYERYFRHLRRKKNTILEIGIGGYGNPSKGGGSLYVWRNYFRNSKIVSFDIEAKDPIKDPNIDIYQGSQTDGEFLDSLVKKYGEFDVIIDDGSHINSHVIFTFERLFPHLKDSGIYVIEDTQTSYWEPYGGSSIQLDLQSSIMGYFKSKIHSINSEELILNDSKHPCPHQSISSLSFYHNLIIIVKSEKSEPSNLIVNNQIPEGVDI